MCSCNVGMILYSSAYLQNHIPLFGMNWYGNEVYCEFLPRKIKACCNSYYFNKLVYIVNKMESFHYTMGICT